MKNRKLEKSKSQKLIIASIVCVMTLSLLFASIRYISSNLDAMYRSSAKNNTEFIQAAEVPGNNTVIETEPDSTAQNIENKEDNLEKNKNTISDTDYFKKNNQKTYQKTVVGFENKNFFADLALTEAERTLGLGGRSGLKSDEGMLFVFSESKILGFWMKEMKFPIDIVWIDKNKIVQGFAENVLPKSFPKVYYSPVPVSYVLEIPSGVVFSNNIKIGDSANFEY